MTNSNGSNSCSVTETVRLAQVQTLVEATRHLFSPAIMHGDFNVVEERDTDL
ncbi:MAG: hypothetical protein SGJ27_29155 [Candidatus Melainabacteria bacterium]|nr:hypothetical protein [Candidatus Melainabacteria bacterium]